MIVSYVRIRLFWEDIPYGLCILKNLVEMLGNFPTPAIDFMIRWHQQFMGKVCWPHPFPSPHLAGRRTHIPRYVLNSYRASVVRLVCLAWTISPAFPL
jgi:hypothetical protein